MATTEKADYKFTVKEGQPSANGVDDAPTWLMCEPMTKELAIVGNGGFLSLHLRPDIRVDEAQQIARYLRDRVTGISYTKFK